MRLSSRRRRPITAAVHPLEPRWLMAATTIEGAAQEVATQIPSFLATTATPASNDLTLRSYFSDANVPGTLVTVETNRGNILLSLTDTATPNTVANFLKYVADGSYDDSIFHRSALDAAGSGTISAANPAGIIQGGGYTLSSSGLTDITSKGTVADEYTNEEYGDIAGTIAMAKTSAPDSATSEWFINNLDESANLDTPTTYTPTATETSYTVFGKVLGGMSVVSDIATLPTADLSLPDGSTTPAPITGLTQAQITAGATIGTDNLVYVYGMAEQADVTYTATSSDPALVSPSISDGVLSFAYGSSATGTAVVTVTATNAFDGTGATNAFAVTVPPTGSTTTGPVAAADAATGVVTGVATPVAPLSNDTDATAALSLSTLDVVAQPAHGTATPNANGTISYTATGGYTGTDTFTYSVADADGYASAATTVTVDVIAAPATVSIGAGTKVGSIAFTQPDGTKGHLALSGGSAAVTFSAGALTTSTKGGVETVTGAGATISDVVVTDGKAVAPSLAITSTGKGTVTLGGLTDVGAMSTLTAPTTSLTGILSVTGLRRLTLASAVHATITVGEAVGDTVVAIPTATDSSLTAGVVTSLTSKQWLIDDGGAYMINAFSIGKLTVPGTFAENLVVTAVTGDGITTATVAKPSGTWDVGAEVANATVTAPASTWALTSDGLLKQLTVRGDLGGAVTAAEIMNMTVTGAVTGGTITTDASPDATVTQLQRLTVGGALTDATVSSAGNVGTITAASMSGSHVYAGVGTTVASADGLPASVSDLSTQATIRSVTLRAPKSTFANSEIAAYVIDAVALGQVTVANSTTFGVSAHTLSALSATLNPGGRLVLGKAQLKSAAVLAAYVAKRKLTLSDFSIGLY